MKRTLKGMMIKSGIIFLIVPFLILWISFAVSSRDTIRKNTEKEQRTIARLLNLSVENYFYEIDEAMIKVVSDIELQKILKHVDRSKPNAELYNAYEYILSSIRKNCTGFDNIVNIVITNKNGGNYSIEPIQGALKAYTESIENSSQNYGERTQINSINIGKEECFVIVEPIIDTKNIEFVGNMYFVIKKSQIEKYITQELDDKSMFILKNRQNKELYSKNEKIQKQSQAVITESNLNRYGIKVVSGISIWEYWRELFKRQILLLLVFIVSTILVFVLIQYIYRKINGEILKLLDSEKEDTTYFEIKQINQEMMSLIQKNNEGEKKIVKLLNHCDTITLDKLQAQINPHFLYNTLTSIKYIAIENEQKQISELITALIRLLRSTINREGNSVMLKEEMESVKNYIMIQNVIYKGNINFKVKIPENCEDLYVPNFILQPLVENSLFHGIHPEEKGGCITVESKLEDKSLLIFVEDNGDGFTEDSLYDMMGAENNREMMTNFGLKGVQQKIHILYGEDYGILVKSIRNVGATVRIKLPINQERSDRYDESNDSR